MCHSSAQDETTQVVEPPTKKRRLLGAHLNSSSPEDEASGNNMHKLATPFISGRKMRKDFPIWPNWQESIFVLWQHQQQLSVSSVLWVSSCQKEGYA